MEEPILEKLHLVPTPDMKICFVTLILQKKKYVMARLKGLEQMDGVTCRTQHLTLRHQNTALSAEWPERPGKSVRGHWP
jgi:hypothetical protein